jgi:hypothetical protein
MHEPINETVGGGLAVVCNVAPDVEHVAPRASSGDRPSGRPFTVARRSGLTLQFVGQSGKRVVRVIGVLSRKDVGFRVIERGQQFHTPALILSHRARNRVWGLGVEERRSSQPVSYTP